MNVKNLWGKVVLKNYAAAGLSLSLLSAILILIFKRTLPPQVPLFYGLPVGEAQLTSYWGFLIAPAASLVISFINILISSLISDNFYKRVLIISSFFISVLVIITTLKIIFLVGFF
jgi:hypothetical protein